MTKYDTLPEMTAAHPEWRRAEGLPSDILLLPMISVYTQRCSQYVLSAMRSGELRASQPCRYGTWQARLVDVQRWAMHLPSNVRPLQRRSA